MVSVLDARAVAHQPADLDEVAREIDRRHGAIGRRAHQPLSQVDQEGIVGDQQRARSARRDGGEGRLEIVLARRCTWIATPRAAARPCTSRPSAAETGLPGSPGASNRDDLGHELTQELEALRGKLGDRERYARHIAAWPVQACDETHFSTGSPPATNTIGMVDVAPFAANAVTLPPVVTIAAADELGGEPGEPLVMSVRIPVIDAHALFRRSRLPPGRGGILRGDTPSRSATGR